MKNEIKAVLLFAILVVFSGCCKNNELVKDPAPVKKPDPATVALMQQSYDNARIYNDSLGMCSHQSMSSMCNSTSMACCNNMSMSMMMMCDTTLCKNMTMHFDQMFHQADSLFNHYHKICMEQMGMGSHNGMGSGMHGGTGGNHSHTDMACHTDSVDWTAKMNSLQQMHLNVHPK